MTQLISLLLKSQFHPYVNLLRIIIVNTSFMTGIVPSQLNIAKVIPVFKKGDPNCIENYRPISILSCFSKFLKNVFTPAPLNFWINIIFLLNHSLFFVANIQPLMHSLILLIKFLMQLMTPNTL